MPALDDELAAIDALLHQSPQTALTRCEALFARAFAQGDPQLQLHVAERYGLMMDHLGRAQAARTALFDAIQVAQVAHLFGDEARITERVARGYYTEGQYRLAIQYWARAAQLAERIDAERATWVLAKIGLGQVFFALNDPANATWLHREALSRIRLDDDPFLQVRTYLNLAVDLLQTGDVSESESWLIKAQLLCEQHDFPDFQAEAMMRRAQHALKLGLPARAREWYLAALAKAVSVDYRWGQSQVLAGLAELDAEVGDHRSALAAISEALQYSEENHFLHMAGDQYFAAARYAEALGDASLALSLFRKGHHAERQLRAMTAPGRDEELEEKAGLRPARDVRLLELSNHNAVADGEVMQTCELVCNEGMQLLGAGRLSVLMLDESRTRLDAHCVVSRMPPAQRAWLKMEVPALFDWLSDGRMPLIAHDACYHPQTWPLAERLMPGIRGAMLGFTVRCGATVLGMLLIEVHQPHRNWTPDEVMYGQQLADLVSRAMTIRERLVFQRQISVLNCELIEANEALEARVAERTAELAAQNEALRELNDKVQQLAIRDELTGLINRRAMFAVLEDERMRAERLGQGFAVALFDVDYFKRINDTQGHLAGDAVLRRVALAAQHSVREVDHVARYGGEEFLILMPATDGAGAVQLAERVRGAIAALRFDDLGCSAVVTISAGVTTFHRGESLNDMIARADRALYRAKAVGRNAVVQVL
ncbi:diguanylate cyclase [Chitinibacteraceae bacterium HSL-7]